MAHWVAHNWVVRIDKWRVRRRRAWPLVSSRTYLYRAGVRGEERYIGIVTGDLFRVRCAEVWVNSENTAMRMARVDEFSVSAIIRYQGDAGTTLDR
jgi:hypothetical protein